MVVAALTNRRAAKPAIAVFVCSLLFTAPSHALTDDMFAVMMRMMLAMAGMMSNAMLDNSGDWAGWNTYGTPWQTYGAPWGMNPWNSYLGPGYGYASPWDRYGYTPWEDSRSWQEIPPPSSTSSSIEGRWTSTTGERLEIYGDRFKLGTAGTSIVGMLRIEGNILTMYSPQTNITTRYTFLLNERQLVLSSGGEGLLVFQRHPSDVYSGY